MLASSMFAKVRRLLMVLGACVILLLPAAAAQAATRWGPVRSTDRVALASGTWDAGSRLLSLTLTDRSRGPKCAWAVVTAGSYVVPLHACGSTKAFRFQVTETSAAAIKVCSGTRRHAAAATCRTKILG